MKPKWTKGGRIDDPQVVIDFILAGQPIFERHKVQNSGWTQNYSIHEIVRRTRMGHFFIALPAHLIPNSEAD